MRGLRARGHECIVALAEPSRAARNLYDSAGYDVKLLKSSVQFDHSTVARRRLFELKTYRMFAALMTGWGRAQAEMLQLVEVVRPDVVHLNSMPLVAHATALMKGGHRFVWHVREPPPDQGLRTHFIRRLMLKCADRMIFICDYDRRKWLGSRRGSVIYNFVDFSAAGEAVAHREKTRAKMGIDSGETVFSFLGGLSLVKGGTVMLAALGILKLDGRPCRAVMPGTEWAPGRTALGRLARHVLPIFGFGAPIQMFENALKNAQLQHEVLRIPFAQRAEELIAASDCLVFPARAPHFPRPIIEAAACGVPAIGSDFGPIREVLEHQITGLCVRPGDPCELSRAMRCVVEDANFRRRMGRAAREKAIRDFDLGRQVEKIEKIYAANA